MLHYRFYSFSGIITLLLGLYGAHYVASSIPATLPQNTASCTIVPPVAVCVGSFDLGLNSNGLKTLNAVQLDNGSYDQSGNFLFFKARRVSPGPCTSDSMFRSQLRFCCDDAGDTVEVLLRVYNISVDTGAISPNFGVGNYADCVAKVIVGESIKPMFVVPADITITCENYINPAAVAYPVATDNCCLDTITYQDQSITYDITCKRGNVRRRFTAYDCAGNTATTTQLLTVVNEQNYHVRMPDDQLIVGCADLSPATIGMPIVEGNNCENMFIGHIDTVQYNNQTAPCMSITRTWRVYNWCNYSGNIPLTVVPNPMPFVSPLTPANLQGPLVGPQGVASVIKIAPFDTAATDFSKYWTQNVNGFIYQQKIFVYDTTSPVGTITSPGYICDMSGNDPNMWQGGNWLNPANNTDDLFEATTEVSLRVLDDCSYNNFNASYIMLLDLDADGVGETFINSANPPPAGSIMYNNVNTAGEQRLFDRRITSIDNKYIFALQKVVQNDSLVLRMRWNTMAEPNTYFTPQLPYGFHRIIWTVTDRCGNSSLFEHAFTVSSDCAAPVVTCIPDLTVNIPNTGGNAVEVQLSDLFFNATDNVTPAAQIEKSIERTPFGTEFPLDNNGFPQSEILYNCNDLGYRPVRIWARDAFGNASYCNSLVLIKDPDEQCTSYPALVSGTAENMLAQPVVLDFDLYQMPDTTFIGSASNAPLGFYFFNDLALFGNYFVRPQLDSSDILNGVNAYDLILISRHILNLEPFDAPYKLIAGDANRSGTVTTFDIVTIRKIILGTLTAFPSNESWRFVPKSFNFPNPNNPFSTQFPEQVNLSSVYGSIENASFYAIKVGDVDYTASPMFFNQPVDRTETEGMRVVLASNEANNGGEWPIYVDATAPIAGFQLALQLNDQQQFIPAIDDSYFAINEQGVLSVVIDDLTALKDGKRLLGWIKGSHNIDLTHTATLRNMAFLPNGEQRSIGLYGQETENLANRVTISPNPTIGNIRLNLSLNDSSSNTCVHIRDLNGRSFYSASLLPKTGKQTIELSTAQWPSGVYAVTLQSDMQTTTVKMIKI